MRRKLVVGNWKMNGDLDSNRALLGKLVAGMDQLTASVVVCIPYPFLAQAKELLSGTSLRWGAQNVCQFASGAYTGEVSAGMLLEFSCEYVIVGHSERRRGLGESNRTVAEKAMAVLTAGMTPIVCVGESLHERERGETSEVVLGQLYAVTEHIGVLLDKAVIAYEPVWAIGTGRTATPDQAQEVHSLLRSQLELANAPDVPVLYGGSVKADNALALFAKPDIDGGLIGGASLNAIEFLAICRAGS